MNTPQGYPPLPQPLAVPVADAHCHLDISHNTPAPDLGAALALAAAVGVDRIVQVGCDNRTWELSLAAAEHPGVVVALGIHPNGAPGLAAAGLLGVELNRLAELLAHPRVRGVGETGLDYFRTGPDGRAAQVESFRAHIGLAKALDLTLVIHDRDAHDDVVAVLLEEGAPDRVQFHCFSGGPELAHIAAKHGWYCSFAGPVSFKSNDQLRAALLVLPVDLLLVETDAPFLTPVPHRGKPNASYLIPLTVRAMADARGTDEDSLVAALSANSERLFGPW